MVAVEQSLVLLGQLIRAGHRPNVGGGSPNSTAAAAQHTNNTTPPNHLARLTAAIPPHPARQANLSRALRHFDIHPLDESTSVGRKLAASGTSDVADAHLAVVAERLGTFILSTDRDDMSALNARFETY